MGEVKEEKNGQLFGFELADSGGVWHPAKAIIKNESVVVSSNGIKNPKDIEMRINNIPGVLENGLFVNLTDKVLVGKIENSIPIVYSPTKVC